jgi:hypothetical protein
VLLPASLEAVGYPSYGATKSITDKADRVRISERMARALGPGAQAPLPVNVDLDSIAS